MNFDLEAARAAYAADGYWVAPVLFDASEVARFNDATQRVVDGTYLGDRHPTLALPFEPGRERPAQDRQRVVGRPRPRRARDRSASWPRSPRCSLTATSVRLWQDQLLYKPPGGPTETTIGWHQDWASWDTVASRRAPSSPRGSRSTTSTTHNGAMQMIPGSHSWGLVPGASNFFGTDRDAQLAASRRRAVSRRRRSVVMRAGQVSFHHPLTFHGSGPNTSDRHAPIARHPLRRRDGRRAVSRDGIWQHYNLALFQERGGELGQPYGFDDLCPTVFAQK